VVLLAKESAFVIYELDTGLCYGWTPVLLPTYDLWTMRCAGLKGGCLKLNATVSYNDICDLPVLNAHEQMDFNCTVIYYITFICDRILLARG
jgi:hypothetical protein